MAVTLHYVTLDELDFVMSPEVQAEVTDDLSGPNDIHSANETTLKQALKFAESTAESYLMGFDLPISPVPNVLKYAILNIAKYYLLTRDGRAAEDELNKYEQALTWLRDVRDSAARLPNVEEDPEAFVGHLDSGDMVFSDLPYTDYAYYYGGL